MYSGLDAVGVDLQVCNLLYAVLRQEVIGILVHNILRKLDTRKI